MNRIQLLVYDKGRDLSQLQPSITHPGIRLLKTHRFGNPHYLAIDIAILPAARPGAVPIKLNARGKTQAEVKWLLKQRRPGRGTQFAQGL